MRLSKEVPEVKEALERGTVNLSVIGTVQKFIRHERAKNNRKYTPEEKRDLLNKMEHKSKLEAEQFFTNLSPEFIPHEKQRVLTPTQTEIRLVADQELLELMAQMKSKLIQKGNVDPSLADVFKEGLKKALKVNTNLKQPSTQSLMPQENKIQAQVKLNKTLTSPGEVPGEIKEALDIAEKTNQFKSRPYISVSIRKELSKETGNQCTYVSPLTGKRCLERRFLQIEHCDPFAKGGSSELENLTLLCATHNRLRAIEYKGLWSSLAAKTTVKTKAETTDRFSGF